MIAAEDAKFVEHEGFDWDGIEHALEKNQKKGRVVAGGSTITQQLAKNLFLSPSRRATCARREEAVVTVMLETMLPKRRILELYLNVIEWGSGVFGAEAAARHYFGVSAGAAFGRAGGATGGDGAHPAPLRAQSRFRVPRPRRDDPRTMPSATHDGRAAADPVRLAGSVPRGDDRGSRRLDAPGIRRIAGVAHELAAVSERPMPDTVEAKSTERTERARTRAGALADDHRAAAQAPAGRGPVHEQRQARESRDEARGTRRERASTSRTKAAAAAQARPPASGGHRLHPRGAAARRAALHLGPRQGATRDGEILLEVSDAVRESLISSMDTEELVAAAETLDADEIAELAPDLPQEVMDDVFQSLPLEEREQLRAAMSFDDDMVGALMDFEDVQVRPDVTLEVVLRYLRRLRRAADRRPTSSSWSTVTRSCSGVLPINRLHRHRSGRARSPR